MIQLNHNLKAQTYGRGQRNMLHYSGKKLYYSHILERPVAAPVLLEIGRSYTSDFFKLVR